MNTVDRTLSELIDTTLVQVQSPADRGASVTLGTALDTSGTSFILSANNVSLNVNDIIEFDSELLLVLAVTDDPTPEYTVARGYNFSTAATHAVGTYGQVNPEYPRVRVSNALRQAFARFEALGLPLVKSGVFYPYESNSDSHRQVLPMPEDTRRVFSVKFDLYELDNWEFIDDLPTSSYSTGKVIRLRRGYSYDDGLQVVYQAPYRWSSFPDAPEETDTITIPEGAEDLPSLYAIARMASNREVSRFEIDKAEEWAAAEPSRNGLSGTAVNRWWQEFYRALDEARRLDPPLPRRPYIKRPRPCQ